MFSIAILKPSMVNSMRSSLRICTTFRKSWMPCGVTAKGRDRLGSRLVRLVRGNVKANPCRQRRETEEERMDRATRITLLKDEYLLLQKFYEDFDARVVTIKGWSASIGIAAIGGGFYQS